MTERPIVYQTKYQYRCTWLKIFHHNINKGVFDSLDQAKYWIEEGKFSILGLINDNYKIDGKFEFLLELPNLTKREGMNRWAQIDNPLYNEEVADEYVRGFESITLSWPNSTDIYDNSYVFCGLSLSSSKKTLIDGNCYQGKWFFSIGAISTHIGNYFPGETEYNKETILWLRVERGTHEKFCAFPMFTSILALTSSDIESIALFKVTDSDD